MSRTIIVSNRVGAGNSAQAGGLAVVLADAIRQRGGMWFGWSGTIEENTGQTVCIERTRAGFEVATLPISKVEHEAYYLGYANSVLWPVFHTRLDLAQFEAGYFSHYEEVNRRFAAALKGLIEPNDIIWVHDYHFVLMGAALRELGVTNRIGFFLHIPVPPAQVFLSIPEHMRLSQALAAYDLVGLQTTIDVGHMIDCLEHSAQGTLIPDGRVRVGERVVAIMSCPVGIDVEFFKASAKSIKGEPRRVTPKRDRNRCQRTVIGVDRLDYSKGLPQKFRAFGRFLEQCPEFHDRVVLTQIAAPTRESVEAYTDIRKELESLSGSINGRYSDLEWIPIRYINRSIARGRLVDAFRSADVALVTPLRDGMNLVAKEYVAAQDPADPGVLILSRFAGAAEELSEALIVNPYNIDEMAGAIRQALTMPVDERRARNDQLMARIAAGDARQWSTLFLATLSHLDLARGGAKSRPPKQMRSVLRRLARA